MNSPIDDVAFLARSENRIAILGLLTDGEPHSRNELMDASDVSRPTLARILDELDSRTWITQRGQTCRITSLGAWVHEEFTELLEAMETAQKLRDVVEWLPTDTLAFDFSCLTEATITLPRQSEPLAPMNRASALERTAKYSRVFTHALPTPCLNAHWQAITTETIRASLIFPATSPSQRALAGDYHRNGPVRRRGHTEGHRDDGRSSARITVPGSPRV